MGEAARKFLLPRRFRRRDFTRVVDREFLRAEVRARLSDSSPNNVFNVARSCKVERGKHHAAPAQCNTPGNY